MAKPSTPKLTIPAQDRWTLYQADPTPDGCIHYAAEYEQLTGGFLNFATAEEGQKLFETYGAKPPKKQKIDYSNPFCSIRYFNGFGYKGAPAFNALSPLRKDEIMATLLAHGKANGRYTVVDGYREAMRQDPELPRRSKAHFSQAFRQGGFRRMTVPNARRHRTWEIAFAKQSQPSVVMTPDWQVIFSYEQLNSSPAKLKKFLRAAGVEVQNPQKTYRFMGLHISRFEAYLKVQGQAFGQNLVDGKVLTPKEKSRLLVAFARRDLVPLRMMTGGRTTGDYTIKAYNTRSGTIQELEVWSSRKPKLPTFSDFLKAKASIVKRPKLLKPPPPTPGTSPKPKK